MPFILNCFLASHALATGWHVTGFLKLLLFACQHVCVCVSAPKGINNFGLKQLSITVKKFITKVLEYKLFKNNLYAIHFLVMSPCLHDFLLMSLYIYNNVRIMIVDLQ